MPRPSSAPRIAGADVEHDRHPAEPLAIVRHELRQGGQELARQVVDDRELEVLEQLRRRGLAGPRETGEDHDMRLATAVGSRRGDLRTCHHRMLSVPRASPVTAGTAQGGLA
jgi:hypothetical protein